jgi:hypothetical protein
MKISLMRKAIFNSLNQNKYAPYFLIIIVWLLAILSKFKINGLVYGFDFGMYQPDGALYTFRTLTLLGQTQSDAGLNVANWYSTHSFKLNELIAGSLYYESNDIWKLYDTRIMYPLLSAPFVFIMGIPGMLVIPCISLLVLLIAIYKISLQSQNKYAGLIIAILLSFSPVVSRWMLSNTTDGLLVAFISIAAYLLMNLEVKKNGYFLFLIVIFSSFTRFSFLIWIGIVLILIIEKRKKLGVGVFFLSLACFVPTLFTDLKLAVLPVMMSSSLLDKLIYLPISFIKVLFYEFAEIFILDKILFIILIVGFICALNSFDNSKSKLFLVQIFLLFVVGAINGTLGVNFRYQLPILPFLSIVLINNLPNSKFDFLKLRKSSIGDLR